MTIHRIAGRLLVFLTEGTDYDTAMSCADAIVGVPGVARAVMRVQMRARHDRDGEAAKLALSEAHEFTSFKVSARRNHTDFDIDSMMINREIGAVLCEAFPDKRVMMKNPDVTVGVEVVQNATYVYARSVRGIGGLPVGSSGTVVSLLSSGIDSPVALWRMARRGAVCIGVHFSGAQTSDASEFLVDDIARVLEKTAASRVCTWFLRRLPTRDLCFRAAFASHYLVPTSDVQGRRGVGAHRVRGALVTGESLGQVASQTLENIRATDASVDMPVFRPLIGSDKLEIIDQAQRLGTFEISSQDAPDCRTLFMPRSPETMPTLPWSKKPSRRFPSIDGWWSWSKPPRCTITRVPLTSARSIAAKRRKPPCKDLCGVSRLLARRR